jgi:serine/threonine protein kinase/tetratricopeptide (TPR) repeat protein
MATDDTSFDAIFCGAIEIASSEDRAAFIARACGSNEKLRRTIVRLVDAHFQAGSFLESPPAPATVSTDSAPSTDVSGTIIGAYKLLQSIGEGGMGTVYMAEQTQPVRRTVALKLIKAGMDSRQVLARFGAERQALALMDHPNIAKVFDAGTSDTGRPFFVMELVKGIPITKFCDGRRLTVRERLELAIPVCQAVQHAHQKGIIHRDIKPSNVLIALYDGKPVPKIIDFGVAKATGPRLTDQTLYTEFGAVVGTLEYMSPEQAELNQLDIDTRSDIYSLGVLLYELLTGSTPLERKRIKGALLLDLLRVIREEESPRPSTRLSKTEELPSIAACRHVEPRKLSGLVRGELDWIVMKALEKDRGRRYETANGLASDLRRYLDDEPVQACPPTAAYRLKKFTKRHRAVLAAACAFAAVLIAATAISLWQAVLANRARAEAVLAFAGEKKQRREAQDQRDRAVKAEEKAEANLARARAAVDDYLTTVSESRLLDSPLPGLQPLRKELLSTALKYYEDFVERHQDDADLRAELAAAILRVGEITHQISSKEEALKAFQRASSMYESLAGAASSPSNRSYRGRRGRCLVRIAMIQFEQGRSDESLRSFERSIALLDQLDAIDPAIRADRALAHHYLSLALLNRQGPQEAMHHQRVAIELREGLAAEFPARLSYRIDLASSLSNLGFILMRGNQLSEAFDSVRRANEIQRALVVEHPEDPRLRHTLALSTQGMASILNTLGRWKESRPLYVEAVAIMSRLVSENPAVTDFRRVLGTSAEELGQCLVDHDEIDAGLIAFAQARDQAETVRGMNPNDVRNVNTLASIHRGIGKTYAKQGKTADALASLHEAIVLGERIAAEDNLFTYDLACGLALYGEVLGRDQGAASKKTRDNSQDYSDKAMAVLKQAVDRGWRQADWTGRDPDLSSLRSRGDFQALLKSIRQNPKSTAPDREPAKSPP